MSIKPIWTPSAEQIEKANITNFSSRIKEHYLETLKSYQDLHNWSIEYPELFWKEIWNFFNVKGDIGSDRILINKNKMPGATWFPDATLNFAENLLRYKDEQEALVFWNEKKERQSISGKELYIKVSSFSNYLRSIGIKKGDRVAAFLPNIPEAIIAMLATSSIGAVWSSCSPDFGIEGVLERFLQIAPKVLIVCDGYTYKGKEIGCRDKVNSITTKLNSLEKTISCLLYTSPSPRDS